MLIWILALILLAIAGACGYRLGAVRFGVSLVGLILGIALALPLGPYLNRLVPMVGLKNPLWTIILPPIVVFLIVYFIFLGISFVIHRKVELHLEYKASDDARFGWERINRAVGLWVGLVVGGVWLFLFALVIYVAGYFTVQVASDESNSLPVRLLNQARQELSSTGLDRAVAPFDPMPPRYYEGSDILGLIYQNPILVSRLALYPPFLLTGERPEIQELAKDTDFNQMILSKADVLDILKHPKLQAIMQNPEIVQELLGQDFKDLRAFLQTGISPKYEEEKILGKWKLDPYATMAQERKHRPDMSSTEMRRLKTVMTEIMSTVSLTATTDKKITLKAEGIADKLKQLYQPAAPVPVPAAQAAPAMSQQLAQRYGVNRPRQQQRVAAPVAAAKPVEIPYTVLSAQGAWEHEGENYQLKVQDEKGKSQTLVATADEERLTLANPNLTLVFARVDS